MNKQRNISFGILILAIISVIFMSGCTQTTNNTEPQVICRHVQESYEDCKKVQVPYEAQEEYTEQEPYTDKECIYRNYDAKGGYMGGPNFTEKWDWAGLHSLFDTAGNPVTEGFYKYYVKNYEDISGRFTISISYWDENKKFLESFDYTIISVGPDEIEYGYITYNELWKNKPGKAESFNMGLKVPQTEECETITKYRTVTKTRTITKYKTEEQCETKYKTVQKCE